MNGLTFPHAVLFFGALITGLGFGMKNTFVYLHLQNELKASSKLISYMNTAQFSCQALLLLVSEKMIDFVGDMNVVAINIVFEVVKLLMYSFIQQSPPYFAFGLHILHSAQWGFAWVAMLKYGFKITPPHLFGTLIAICTVLVTVLSKYTKFLL